MKDFGLVRSRGADGHRARDQTQARRRPSVRWFERDGSTTVIRTAAQAGWVALNLLVATWSRLSVVHTSESAAARPRLPRPYLRRRSSSADMRRPRCPGQGDSSAVRSARPVVLPGLPGAETRVGEGGRLLRRQRSRPSTTDDNHGPGPPLRRVSVTCATEQPRLVHGSLARDAVRLRLVARHPGPMTRRRRRGRLDTPPRETAWSKLIVSVGHRLMQRSGLPPTSRSRQATGGSW